MVNNHVRITISVHELVEISKSNRYSSSSKDQPAVFALLIKFLRIWTQCDVLVALTFSHRSHRVFTFLFEEWKHCVLVPVRVRNNKNNDDDQKWNEWVWYNDGYTKIHRKIYKRMHTTIHSISIAIRDFQNCVGVTSNLVVVIQSEKNRIINFGAHSDHYYVNRRGNKCFCERKTVRENKLIQCDLLSFYWVNLFSFWRKKVRVFFWSDFVAEFWIWVEKECLSLKFGN